MGRDQKNTRRNVSKLDVNSEAEKEIRAIRHKRGKALDDEMTRRIGATKVPEDPRAQHAAAMILTRALRSVPTKYSGALDDLMLALEDENETWIYDCLMFILQKSAGQPITPRDESGDDGSPDGTPIENPKKGKIISLIPGEKLSDSEGTEESEEVQAIRNRAEAEYDPVTRDNLLAVLKMRTNRAAQA